MVNHALHDHAVHFIPWVVLVLFWLAGTLLHAFVVTTWSRAGTVALILAGTVVMIYSVWCTQRTRSGTARWHGMLTVASAGAWLALCTITGFITLDPTDAGGWKLTVHGATVGFYLAIGTCLAAIWNTRINARYHAIQYAEWQASQPPEVTPMERAGHKGAMLTLRTVDQWRSEGTLILAPGDTLTSFQKDLEAVETAHGFPPGSMTVTQRRGVRNAAICDVTVMHGNPIEHAQPWPGLLVRGVR